MFASASGAGAAGSPPPASIANATGVSTVTAATATSARIDGMSIASAATDGLAVTASGLKIAAKKFVHVLVVVEILGAILGATPPIVRESLERRLASIVAK